MQVKLPRPARCNPEYSMDKLGGTSDIYTISPSRLNAFRAFLVDLFERYPPDDTAVPSSLGRPAEFYRDEALRYIANGLPKLAAHYACETGAPDDEIVVVYTLLFT